jgi:hypothetical protein
MPARIAARLDWANPELLDSWGGPFNGQAARAELARQIVDAIPAAAIVETGTFRGTTTEFFAHLGVPIHTVDVKRRFYHYARRRFRGMSHVHVARGDSRAFLRQLARHSAFPKERVFFYLDSHWYGDLPLREEVHIVRECWRNSVVMIDDFQVPGDAGYAFDDYGPDAALTIRYLESELVGFRAFWPATPSVKEGGARRGCVVLANDGWASNQVAELPMLRGDGTYNSS